VTSQFAVLFAVEALPQVFLRFSILSIKAIRLPSQKTVVNVGHFMDYTTMVLLKTN